MGGYGSGRTGGHVTSDGTASIVLDVHWFTRKGFIQPNAAITGRLTMGDVLEATIKVTTYETGGSLRITGTAETFCDGRFDIDQIVYLATSPGTLGGLRWWFRCPRHDRRVAKLYLPNGAKWFASRSAYRLAYQSQRETALDRAQRRVRKLNRAVGGDGGDECPMKPKWMRWATYDRKFSAWETADSLADALFLHRVSRLLRSR